MQHETTPDSDAPAPLDKKKVHELLADFPTLMLVTFEQTGATPVARARPMAVVKLEDDCTLWFVTHLESSKVTEAVDETSHGAVTGQAQTRYLSVQGTYDLVTDRAKVRSLWNKSYEVWFPNGPDDTRVCLLRFTPTEAEVWDASGVKGLKYLFQAAKALVTGEPPKPGREQHQSGVLKPD